MTRYHTAARELKENAIRLWHMKARDGGVCVESYWRESKAKRVEMYLMSPAEREYVTKWKGR